MMNSSLLTSPSSLSSSHIQTPATMIFDQEDFLDQIFSSSPWPSVPDEAHPPPPLLPPPCDGFVDSRQQQIMMIPLYSHHHHQNDVVNIDSSSLHALYNGFSTVGSLPFHQGSGGELMNKQGQTQTQTQTQVSAFTATGGVAATQTQSRTKVRARRGQATDPHSIAERLRRERISERMKALQQLVPNGNKTDKASMLDEIIDYVKFLQLQVKVLSMSRLGGAASVSSQISEGGGSHGNASSAVAGDNNVAVNTNDSALTMTEHQVAKLMEEDMGSAMHYLQGKGLCLMSISLATAISTATCHSRNPLISSGAAEIGGPSSPPSNLSGMSVQLTNTVKLNGN